ncbi:MAG: pyridoxal phosphate-dependent decarboxylase family protein [Thermoguttaceae bacterium]
MTLPAEIHEAQQRIKPAYDPDLWQTLGRRLIDLLADHLRTVEAGQAKVLRWREPPENVAQAAEWMAQSPGLAASGETLAERFAQLVRTALERGLNLHDPRYIGHQVAASAPLAGLFDALGSVTNQAMAIYDMGPWATAAERAMVQCLGRAIGWTEGQFSGLVTHGASLANLTALLTARNVTLPESWLSGTAAGAPPALVVHADAHYSVSRAAGVLGLGTGNVVRVGLDARRRMDVGRLDAALAALRVQGRPIVAVAACACSTPVGAFDPLEEIAEVCRRHGVWLHVDAAHGGAAALSPRYRHLVAGLDRADSLVWDAHKMLFVPALCAFVFYRRAANKFETFRQDAPYLFDPAAPGLAEFDSGLTALECTKRAAALGLWGLWSLFGPELFADLVDITFAMGRLFYEKLAVAADFVPLHEPECNIVVFRHVPVALRDAPAEVLGRFQFELRRRIVEAGDFYIVSTKFDGVGALRVTIINPLTTPAHLDLLLAALRQAGKQLLRASPQMS